MRANRSQGLDWGAALDGADDDDDVPKAGQVPAQTQTQTTPVPQVWGATGAAPGRQPPVDAKPAVQATAPAMLSPERATQMKVLKGVILDAISRTEPNYSGAPTSSVFHTNFDWHSSVHAHWAALAMARVTGDSELEAQVMSRLTPEALKAERKLLAKGQPAGEVPYGHAWMTLLTRELESRSATMTPELKQQVTAMKTECQDRVLAWLERPGACPGEQGVKGISATHNSWLFAFAMLKQSSGDDPRVTPRLVNLQKRLDAARPVVDQYQGTEGDFLDLPAVLAFIDKTPPLGERANIPYPAGRAGDLPPLPVTDATEHMAGKTAMRLWPYAQDAAAGRVNAASANAQVDARMREMFSNPDYYRTSFEMTSHWVPQFMFMGMLQQLGPDAVRGKGDGN